MNDNSTGMIRTEENNTFIQEEEDGVIAIHFNRIRREIKPLHGINNSPVTLGEPLPELREAGIPYVRLHDTGGDYGQNRFVDIPNIFRDFDADPMDPDAYDFAFTDAYLKGLAASGMKIFYRLGVTIENGFMVKPLRIHPPADFLKWAKICEGIVNHYNNGWANGFHYNIEYWEIWNEPEQPAMWTGTMEQYFEFYQVVSRYLKKKFPALKIGGYASSGFCAYTKPEAAAIPKFRNMLVWFEEFLRFVRANRVPLDFFSWHYYPATIEDLRANSQYVDEQLQKYGFDSLEVIFDEWNYMDWSIENRFDAMKEMPGAAFVAAAFCAMQKLNIAKAMYYDALPNREYCGLYYFPSRMVTKTYYCFRMFDVLYRLGKEAECVTPEKDGIYGLAATNGSQCAALISNLNQRDRSLTLRLDGTVGVKPKCTVLDANQVFVETKMLWKTDKCLRLPARSVILLEWK